jgi:transcriptional regulator with PAS, ATPase and Fis domain
MSKSDVLEKENITLNHRQTFSSNGQENHEISGLRSLADLEKYHIKRILDEVKWNKVEASHILEITRPTLNAKIDKYNLVQ